MTNQPSHSTTPSLPDALTQALQRSILAVADSFEASVVFLLLGDQNQALHRICTGMEARDIEAIQEDCYTQVKTMGILECPRTAEKWPATSVPFEALTGIPLRPQDIHLMGALFLGHETTRILTETNHRLLRHFAAMMFDQINLHRNLPEDPRPLPSHLEAAIENCPASIVVSDPEGRAIVWNKATTVNTGYTAEEALGRYSPLSFPDPDRLSTLARKLYTEQSVHRFVLPIIAKDGRRALHGVSAATFTDDAGDMAGTISLASDITETLRMQEELELFRTALVHSQDGVALVELPLEGDSRAPVISFVNEAFCRITGYTEEELIGSSPFALIGEDTSGETLKQIAATVHLGKPLRIEVETRRKDGTHVWTEINFTPLPQAAEDGHMRCAVFQRDIGERRELHEAIARSEARFRSMVQNISEVFTLVDEQGVIHYQSPSVTVATGYSPDELIGRTMFDYIHPEDLVSFGDMVQRLLAREFKTSPLVSVRVHTRQGTYVWAEGYISDLRDDPDVASLVLNWRDVSEIRRLQKQLFMSDRLASIGTLAAGVAHEINNPLTYILTNLEYTLCEMKGLQPGNRTALFADITEALEEARDGAERVGNIVHDLGAFSRPETETSKPLDAQHVLQKTLNLARNEVRQKAAVHEDYEPIPLVCVNESRLGQVFLNLIVNAAQALPEVPAPENIIRISTRLGADGMVRISIADTGVGIPTDMHTKIFDPFFSTKPVGQGTGLGLSICHGLVEAMGGQLTVKSEEGKGSTFTVSLPACDAGLKAEDEPAESASIHSSRKRILIVDDEPMIRQAMERLLEDRFDISMAADGLEALDLMNESEDFDAILCDLLMPNMTGMELYENIRYANPAVADRFVFMTGGAFTAGAKAFIDMVTRPLLTKPFTDRELQRALATMTGENPEPHSLSSSPS